MVDKRVVLGVDIGGTKVASGIVDSEGTILFKARVPMNVKGSAAEGMECVHAAIRIALESEFGQQVSAIGVASPGPLDLSDGTILNTPNLPCWKNFPLGDSLLDVYPQPVRVDNDANAAGLAESAWGAGSQYRNVFYVTIGTGIGTALVFDGSLYYGRTGTAPEGGHMTLDYRAPVLCGCGKRGCLEGLASGPAIARRVRERYAASADSSLLKSLCAGDPSLIDTQMIATAWRGGDALAREVLTETADLLTVWLGNIIDLVEPDVIVVGGGVAELVSEWFGYMVERLPACSINSRCTEIPLKVARYGADAGIAGAAALCFAPPVSMSLDANAKVLAGQ